MGTYTLVFVLTYLVAYNSGYNRGVFDSKCGLLPWKEQLKCFRNSQ